MLLRCESLEPPMSQFGQTRTYRRGPWHVSFTPISRHQGVCRLSGIQRRANLRQCLVRNRLRAIRSFSACASCRASRSELAAS
jgi:hypothetical protein